MASVLFAHFVFIMVIEAIEYINNPHVLLLPMGIRYYCRDSPIMQSVIAI